mmetsp:Transcript_6683/g.11842  ORF Transcript_6683/g.11842 Transcript_6683/m.11842 type:complete len:160 (-) Transcript_6683:278-757(-)
MRFCCCRTCCCCAWQQRQRQRAMEGRCEEAGCRAGSTRPGMGATKVNKTSLRSVLSAAETKQTDISGDRPSKWEQVGHDMKTSTKVRRRRAGAVRAVRGARSGGGGGGEEEEEEEEEEERPSQNVVVRYRPCPCRPGLNQLVESNCHALARDPYTVYNK